MIFLYDAFSLNLIHIHESGWIELFEIVCGVFGVLIILERIIISRKKNILSVFFFSGYPIWIPGWKTRLKNMLGKHLGNHHLGSLKTWKTWQIVQSWSPYGKKNNPQKSSKMLKLSWKKGFLFSVLIRRYGRTSYFCFQLV